MKNPWQPFHEAVALNVGEVHIVLMSVSHSKSVLAHYQSLLSEAECCRQTHPHFIVARGALRALLGHYLQCAPQALCFEYTEKGKPILKNYDLHFNVSHAHEKIIFIFSKESAVGVDIEYTQRVVNYLKIAKRFFSPSEFQFLASQKKADLPKLFFTLWTCKEAYVKARGEGVSAFGEFAVDIASELPCVQDNRQKLALLSLGSSYQGAYAVHHAGEFQTKFFRLF